VSQNEHWTWSEKLEDKKIARPGKIIRRVEFKTDSGLGECIDINHNDSEWNFRMKQPGGFVYKQYDYEINKRFKVTASIYFQDSPDDKFI